jgi:hypothetical protein
VDEACLDPTGTFYQKWQEQIQVSQNMLNEAGVKYETTVINRENDD